MNRKLWLSMLIAACATLVLAACGDSDDAGNEEAIVTTIETSQTSTDPADCQVYSTPSFLEQTQVQPGRTALASCEADAEGGSNLPESVEVDNVKIGDRAASAEVTYDGGDFDGETLQVALVKKDDRWKLDSVERIVGFDREAFIAEFEEGVDESSATPAQRSCIQKAVRGAENAELEALIISGSEATQNKLLGDC